MQEVKTENTSQIKFAGFWIRVFASIVDGFIIFLLSMALVAIVPVNYDNVILEIFVQLLSVAVIGFACAKFYVSDWQATPGKKILSIKVVDEKGYGKISFNKALKRVFLPIVCISVPATIASALMFTMPELSLVMGLIQTFLFILALFWYVRVAFTKEKTALHDTLAGTRVIFR